MVQCKPHTHEYVQCNAFCTDLTDHRSVELRQDMLGFSSNAPRRDCWETEQHYFYDGDDSEEDFYKSTAPSEDIWKKFELVPTPPMSPVRTADGCASYPSPGDKLEWVSQFLGQDEEHEGQYRIDTKEIFGNLSSIINQDCMWSGFSASQCLEKVVSERLSGSAAQTKTPIGVQTGVHVGSRSQDTQVAGTLAADCVDPAAVLTYPYNSNISSKKQASSGSESRTDSSDDEEIDVVTVESKQKKGRSSSATGGGRKPVTIMVRADPHDPEMKHFHISIHQQQHNYAAPSPERTASISAPAANPAHVASSANLTNSAHVASIAHVSDSAPDSAFPDQTDSPQSSDSEDTDKRRAHNFLERKRRNDLRSRFLALRDQIPGLASSAKTPKVAILTRAVEHLRHLHAADRRSAQERRQLKARQRQLLRRLAELKRTSHNCQK
ncbi:hypothetical protein SKAU_G00420600 [Synaphobranchus kaupii]|uniref:BHLH domain-containing protein n=1 Tax=Synaphobranchus kaupii TaxID=118154 RepID=A0A9Q1IB52_SYNKA|nr:hypothetical protein SKAU_G00420600 [Synaphobranchus kaupii]